MLRTYRQLDPQVSIQELFLMEDDQAKVTTYFLKRPQKLVLFSKIDGLSECLILVDGFRRFLEWGNYLQDPQCALKQTIT